MLSPEKPHGVAREKIIVGRESLGKHEVESQPSQLQWGIYRPVFQWVLPSLVMLYAWQQSHFQFEQYWPDVWRSSARYVMQGAVLTMFVLGCRHVADRRLIGFTLLLASTAFFYGELDYLTTDLLPWPAFKGVLFAIAMLSIVSDRQSLQRFLQLNYWFGFLMIGLSTIPILHFLELVNLSYEPVARVGGAIGRPDLDPLSFGVFGRTESYAHQGLPRLQGWASEPLHWSYFVFWTLACWALTFPGFGSKFYRGFYWACLIFILFHIYLIQSTTALIAGLAIFAAVAIIFVVKYFCKPQTLVWSAFCIIVIVPGLLVPFLLVCFDGIEHLILNQQILPEGSNWRGKIDFLSEGAKIFIHFSPSFDSSSAITASHNLVLDLYLRFGYLFLIPILLQLFILVGSATRHHLFLCLVAMLIVVIDNTLVVPGAMFLPSGIMCQLLIYAATSPSAGCFVNDNYADHG